MVAALSVAALAGCSPYGFSKEVGDFDASAKGLATSVAAGHQTLRDDALAAARRDLIYHQRRVAIPVSCQPGQSVKDGPPCRPYAVGGSPVIADPDPIDPKVKELVTVLNAYTGALAAVTKASDRAEFDKEVGNLAKAVQGLMAATGVGVTAAPVIAAGVNLFGWLVGTALDIQRYETLRNAVNAVDAPAKNDVKPMKTIANTLQGELVVLMEVRQGKLLDEAALVRRRIGPGNSDETYRTRLADLEALLAAVEDLRKADPAAAAQGLAKAHEELVAAVNNPKIDFEQLIKSLGELKDKVEAVQKALSEASGAGSAKKGA
ncbi:MAG: hypothetical protein KIT25_17790 [Enhydrobacter sp.]|nr:MAG: hypothetical protein KIT25_17790 [Enhydrobacter sp.]